VLLDSSDGKSDDTSWQSSGRWPRVGGIAFASGPKHRNAARVESRELFLQEHNRPWASRREVNNIARQQQRCDPLDKGMFDHLFGGAVGGFASQFAQLARQFDKAPQWLFEMPIA
jgi:hypothetical protein